MKSYNGFTSEQRERAGRWLNKQWRDGVLRRPDYCRACGQTDGIIDAHAEDYSEPFGFITQEWGLCYICHLMLHCRFGDGREAFIRYVRTLEQGFRWPAATSRSFDVIRRLLNGDEAAWGWARQVRSPRQIPLLTMLAEETPTAREARITGYLILAATRAAATDAETGGVDAGAAGLQAITERFQP